MTSTSCLETVDYEAGAGSQPSAARAAGSQGPISARDIHSYLLSRGIGCSESDAYPSPFDVLALATDLGLTGEQRMLTRSLVDSAEAVALKFGQLAIEQERRIDQSLASGAVTAEAVQGSLMQIGSLTSKIRASYLEAQLVQRRILTREQVARYVRLRRCERSWDAGRFGSSEEGAAG